MEIRINDQKLDFALDKEKIIGEVLAALEQWISESSHILSGLSIDGESISSSMIETALSKEIADVKCLDLYTNPVSELAASSLVNLLDDIKGFEKCSFEEKGNFFYAWKESPCGMFLFHHMGELFMLCENTFLHGNITPSVLYSITEERLREVNTPTDELAKLEPLINEICERLVDLPLDIQTGKDARAAQTIQVFSSVTEKLFRVFRQLDIQGYLSQSADGKQLAEDINKFGDIIKELFQAFEKQDTVLVGDLAEYEAAVRLKELYLSIINNCRQTAQDAK
ncbi:MAG: hypothetical protein LBI28_01035 [Treponema sp.]|jgi:hypothetical protein|nr:hypothetical protein [Treponema sp.]